jgi:hypothetical protein
LGYKLGHTIISASWQGKANRRTAKWGVYVNIARRVASFHLDCCAAAQDENIAAQRLRYNRAKIVNATAEVISSRKRGKATK